MQMVAVLVIILFSNLPKSPPGWLRLNFSIVRSFSSASFTAASALSALSSSLVSAVSAKTLTAPVGMISPKFAGAVKFYRDKIKENLKDIEIDKVKKREAIESGDIKLAEEIQEEIIRKERVIELNQARMLEHKADYMSYALMGGAAFAFASASASAAVGLAPQPGEWASYAASATSSAFEVMPVLES